MAKRQHIYILWSSKNSQCARFFKYSFLFGFYYVRVYTQRLRFTFIIITGTKFAGIKVAHMRMFLLVIVVVAVAVRTKHRINLRLKEFYMHLHRLMKYCFKFGNICIYLLCV